MSKISIPLDAITSRLQLGDRFSGLRSQSLAQRFSNLKPISEFFDVKRLSKPRDFADVQARVNYNLAYFSSNYAVVFVMLSIYALITNLYLLFDIVFVVGGMWVIGKLNGQDLVIGNLRATTSQLYTGLVCIAVPVGFLSSPISTVLWLIGATGVTILGHASFMDRPIENAFSEEAGARLGRNAREAYSRYQSWELDPRFQEVEDEEDDRFSGGVELDAYGRRRFVSDELRFDGIDLAAEGLRRRHSRDVQYDDENEYSEDGETEAGHHAALTHRHNMQLVLKDKEDELITRALERIARARALGKTNVKLTKAEIDALERLDRSEAHQQRASASAHKSNLTTKRGSPTKGKVAEVKKASKEKNSGASRSGSPKSSSPKPKATPSRQRGRSTASEVSARRDSDAIDYPLPPPERYTYPSYASGHGDERPSASRTGSDQSLRRLHAQQIQHSHHPSRYYTTPEDGPLMPPPTRASRGPRPDPSEPDWEPRTRSNSSLISYPIDQLPNHTHTNRAPRFDPRDPRFSSPQRRVVSGPADVRNYLVAEEHENEVDTYRVESSEESEDSNAGVQVEVTDRPRGAYSIRTTRGAAAAPRSSGVGRTGKSSKKR